MIRVGITAWSEPTLVKSGFYPPGTKTAEARLRYYATQFPIAENDSTYYAIPPIASAEAWVERTPPGFTMNVKAFATLTEHYTDPHRLPPDLRSELPDKRRVYPKDMPDEVRSEIAKRFAQSIEPLAAARKLGVVLFQFPVWFTASPDNHAKLANLRKVLPGLPIAVEFRNATWMSDRNRERTLALLRDHGLAYTSVDEPQGYPSSIPPIAVATTDVAIVRFHGRNRVMWTKNTKTARERFEYLYTKDELAEWVSPIRALDAREVHVLMNNCYRDYSVQNARDMIDLLQ